MMKRFQAIAAAITILFAALATKPAGAENVLRWASATEPLTFDPHSANTGPTNAANLQVHEPLVDFNSRYEIEPALAVAWKLISPTTWQFDLRRGVRFHDGTPFTSEDVVFSLNRALSETSDFKGDLPPITTVAATDDHTVQITTAAPDPILPEELNAIFIMSKRWAEQHDALLPAVYGQSRVHNDADHVTARCEPQLSLARQQNIPRLVFLPTDQGVLAEGAEPSVRSGLASGAGQVVVSAGSAVFGPSARPEMPAAESPHPSFAALRST
jgi:Bacterial extracellular solute-binding proteins, family 5 Middle